VQIYKNSSQNFGLIIPPRESVSEYILPLNPPRGTLKFTLLAPPLGGFGGIKTRIIKTVEPGLGPGSTLEFIVLTESYIIPGIPPPIPCGGPPAG
jgi:hypothetical protein